MGGRRAHTRAEEGERARERARAPVGARAGGGRAPEGGRERVGATRSSLAGAGLQGERDTERQRGSCGPARRRRGAADAGELRVAYTVALLTSGSLAAGDLPEAPRAAGKGAGCLAVPQGETGDVQAPACHCPTAHAVFFF